VTRGGTAALLRRSAAAATGGFLWLTLVAGVWAASPSPGPATGGDPRSSGQGPGLVGDPGFALLAVIAIGVASVVATLIYVRLTAREGGGGV
jgi:hypothetical protein